jgi:hypothetical protein
MKEASEEIRWVVFILLTIAAIIANTVIGTNLGIIVLVILLAICGGLAVRYE